MDNGESRGPPRSSGFGGRMDRRSEPRHGPSGSGPRRPPPRRVSVDGHPDSHDGSGADQGKKITFKGFTLRYIEDAE